MTWQWPPADPWPTQLPGRANADIPATQTPTQPSSSLDVRCPVAPAHEATLDEAAQLHSLRQEFPRWGFVPGPRRQEWTAVHARYGSITRPTAAALRAAVLASTTPQHIPPGQH
jgi:hypothetical protein